MIDDGIKFLQGDHDLTLDGDTIYLRFVCQKCGKRFNMQDGFHAQSLKIKLSELTPCAKGE